MAKKYIWWKKCDDPSLSERRIVAQLMNLGDFDDVRLALETLGMESFADALAHSEPGWFSARSWSYWHYRCGLTPLTDNAPALPRRNLD